ncbi:hypothetical protein DL764_007972 [Monosporascus ibericus]|uniref:tRNA (guanine(10)-N(2))-methyltransferase n=1 Tax=Monosporascus ibericus TaxID=155417 RepID=A0A4Q4SYP2_9PEZI|nr:hypothetical protein DL764_007972 [Monosporascus ibericus]
MQYLIRFTQWHETFRLAEIQSLATYLNIELKIIFYSDELPSEEDARALMKRSILAQSIHEHWATANTWDELHVAIRRDTAQWWPRYKQSSFKINFDTYQGSRSSSKRKELIDSLAYLPFDGQILMSSPEQEFTIFEEWEWDSVPKNIPNPLKVHFGRLISHSVRDLINIFDLKKRTYISTTSMDSELALVTANIALAGPGKIFYDPFVGTGSFPIACAQFGAIGFGSDIDGRSVRGEGGKKSLKGNFQQYGLEKQIGDIFVCDLTNSPVRRARILDGIVCDPPYGVREGLRVLGCKDVEKFANLVEKGKRTYKSPDFVPPKKPYSFTAMLEDILNFASDTLVDNGRLSFWMPTANDEELEIPVPTHPCLQTVVVCTQTFNKWSRRLITYRRLLDSQVDMSAVALKKERETVNGHTADDLNAFRRAYFTGFKTESLAREAIPN